MDCGHIFLAALELIPSKISSVPLFLKDRIMGHIIMASVIVVNGVGISGIMLKITGLSVSFFWFEKVKNKFVPFFFLFLLSVF